MSEQITKDEAHYDKIRAKINAENEEKRKAKQRFTDEVNRQQESHLEKLLRRNKNENTKIN